MVERRISNAGGHSPGQGVRVRCGEAFAFRNVDKSGAVVGAGNIPADDLADEEVLALLDTDEVSQEGVVAGLVVHECSSSDDTVTLTLSGPIGIDRLELTSRRLPVQPSEIDTLEGFIAWLSETPEQAA